MGTLHTFTPCAIKVSEHVLMIAAKDRVAITVANELLLEGYAITSIQTETRNRPVIWLIPDPRLAALVAHDEACYYKHGHDDIGPYRIGQYQRDGAYIQWRERPGQLSWWKEVH